jgi:hypothetical protein
MKRQFKTLFLFLLLVALAPALVLANGADLPDYYQDSYYAELPEMYRRLEAVEGPKILVVGGSNVAFGLDGRLLEQLLAEQGYDYTVCPLGLYAAVGTGAMLDLSRDDLRKGDIVVLAMEPTSETMSGYFGASAFWKCAEDAPELLPELGKNRQAALFGNYVPYLQERLKIEQSGLYPVATDVYAASSFDDRCDMIYDRAGNVMALGWDISTPVDLETVVVAPEFARQVAEYCAEATCRGARVVLSFSPVNRSALTDDSQTAVEAFFQRCNSAFACPAISDPNDYILDSGWFYDNNFHLNSAGSQVRTVLLAEDLLRYLGCYRELAWEWPEMPESIATVPENAPDQGFFLFSPLGEGWMVSGLTESGLEQKTLIVPTTYEGKPVVGLSADALKSAHQLEELRLPETVAALPGGLFRECTMLTRLVLEHRETVCGVEADTFTGADQVRIYVPREAYPLYRDGYGCEENQWTVWLDRIEVYG